MKRVIYLAFVYVGLVIGAGFASGREIMQYFNMPSNTSSGGIFVATFLLMAVCYAVSARSRMLGIDSFKEYMRLVAGRFAVPLEWFMFIYLFCGFFTMISGGGSLLAQSFMMPRPCGMVIVIIICFAALCFDLKGIVGINLALVPCMIFGILYICFYAAMFDSTETFSMSKLAHGTTASAICYVSYNTVSAPSVLVPLQKNMSYKELRFASVAGGFVLGVLILAIWAIQSANFDALQNAELPMLKLAAMTGRANKYIYTAVLFMAICTTAVSQGFGVLEHFSDSERKKRVLHTSILCLAALPFAFADFSFLVAKLYLFFGLSGIFWMTWIFIDFFRSSV